MSKFQIGLLGVFVLLIIGGVIGFATYKGGRSAAEILPSITIWGTFPAGTFNQYVSKINNQLENPLVITYVEKKADQFSTDFVKALARGNGPDAILIPAEYILEHQDKLALVPFGALPQGTFKDSYIQEAQIYLASEGVLALPFTVDPLVMYWNRDTFDMAGIAVYPKTWDEFTGINQKITQKDSNGNVRKSAIAMGDFSNVNNAREILGTLMMQIGNFVTGKTSDGVVVSTVKTSAKVNPEPAISFFTQFVDPADKNYSWNRGMPYSKTAFLSGTLATYFGFASELNDIKTKNSNLNFDVAMIPKFKNGSKITYGKMYGLSIVGATQNQNGVYQIISTLVNPAFIGMISDEMYLPSVRRDVIAKGSSDPYITIFNEAALVSRTWLDAGTAQSNQIFGSMVQSIVSGQKFTNQAINDAGDQLNAALTNIMK